MSSMYILTGYSHISFIFLLSIIPFLRWYICCKTFQLECQSWDKRWLILTLICSENFCLCLQRVGTQWWSAWWTLLCIYQAYSFWSVVCLNNLLFSSFRSLSYIHVLYIDFLETMMVPYLWNLLPQLPCKIYDGI